MSTLKKTIAVVAGGDSSEIVVSMKSAAGIMSFMDAQSYEPILVLLENQNWRAVYNEKEYPINKKDFSFECNGKSILFDCAYITIHGTPGEDGLLQGYFNMIHMPYTSCGVLASALTFNKFACNNYLRAFGVKVADSLLLRRGQVISDENVIDAVKLPCFIKPNQGGSSFGVSKVKCKEDIQAAIAKAFQESDEVIIESFISGTEITCGLFKHKEQVTVLPITEVISSNDFFDFEAKYVANKAQEITPARISDDLADRVRKISTHIYAILNCRGIVRIDYIIDEFKTVNLLEVNTTPGMTPTSFIPQQMNAAQLNIADVFSAIIEDSIAICGSF